MTSSAVRTPLTDATAPARAAVVPAPTGAVTRTVIEYPGLGFDIWCSLLVPDLASGAPDRRPAPGDLATRRPTTSGARLTGPARRGPRTGAGGTVHRRGRR